MSSRGDQSALHTVDIMWNLDPAVISSRDGYRASPDLWIPTLGEFYTTTADLYLVEESVGHHLSASRQHYESAWADVGKTVKPAITSGSGQIATAHWTVGSVTLDAVFAEQLTASTGVAYPNVLYLKVAHANGGISESMVSVRDSQILQDGSQLCVTAQMYFTYMSSRGDQSALHTVDIMWNLDPAVISSRDGYRASPDLWIPTLGEFYTTTADLYLVEESVGHHLSASRQHYESAWADVGKTANPSVSSGSGKIAMAHWEEQRQGLITIDAVFAEHLTTNTGAIIPNGLYIKVIHAAANAISEEIIPLSDRDIIQDGSHIGIDTTMKMTLLGTEYVHRITIDWDFNTRTVLSEDDFVRPFVTFVPVSGEFYSATAYIGIFGDANYFHPEIYASKWATTSSSTIVGPPLPPPIDPTVSAFVTKLNGNKNDLTITVTEFKPDGTPNTITKTFSINNNAAGTYTVGSHKVYVDTKGNTQIRACYIV